MTTIADRLNHLPHPTTSTSFLIWEKTYQFHILKLFLIFTERLEDIEPFSKMNLDTNIKYRNFAKYLYKKSSRVI